MSRAGVFIGVDRTGHLQELTDASAGARRMFDWAVSQGMAANQQARLITDEGGQKVTPDRIADAIAELLKLGLDQLIVYFAGHGVNISRTEHWLLSDAPSKPYAAVNVTGSVELARYCGARHVAIFSDACRVAPQGIQAQGVRGVEVFPNEPTGERSRPVDVFYACLLGKTAAEIPDAALAAGHYKALYTTVLLEALGGKLADVLERDAQAEDGSRIVRPTRLEAYLEAELPRRIRDGGLLGKVNQSPDAVLIASDLTWISRVPAPDDAAPPATRSASLPVPDPLRAATRRIVRSAAQGDTVMMRAAIDGARSAATRNIVDAADQVLAPFGPDHMETECGIKVRGASVVAAECAFADAVILGQRPGDAGSVVRVNMHGSKAASVLLRFDSGLCTVIPALQGYLAALTFNEGDLVDVAYEPSSNSHRVAEYAGRVDEIRLLRSVAAAASREGRFRLDAADADGLARRMQLLKGVDPTLAIYAAYAYHDLQAVERLQLMYDFMRDDLQAALFDVALLARRLLDQTVGLSSGVVPFAPLLSQGWSLLRANRVTLPHGLDELHATLQDSLWSLYDDRGAGIISRALRTQELA